MVELVPPPLPGPFIAGPKGELSDTEDGGRSRSPPPEEGVSEVGFATEIAPVPPLYQSDTRRRMSLQHLAKDIVHSARQMGIKTCQFYRKLLAILPNHSPCDGSGICLFFVLASEIAEL